MTKSDFYDIVKTDEIQISIPHSSHFTIGTSPYYAHQHALGIDIYHSLFLDNYEVLSPVSGEILKVKTLMAPKPKFKDGIDKDYIILVRNPLDPNITYKILHVRPDNIQVGKKVEIGDLLGTTIRNGYFAYWSSPHLHLEIRPTEDAIRASGGISFSLAFNNKKDELRQESRSLKENSIKIHSVFPEFFLGKFQNELYTLIDPFYGVKATHNTINCILDGGIPHYKNGTIISNINLTRDQETPIYLFNQKIGRLKESRGNFGFFKFDTSLKFHLNEEEIRGISLYLANFKPLVKIIPFQKNDITIETKTISQITLSS
ncbi:MAG: hypothetical protein ACFFDB_09705 [Promethearchaeota archaeon]